MDVAIHGACDEGFGRFADAFRANFDSGLELGASLSVTHAGRKVVDLWAGPMWPDTTRPWGEDTIVPVASSGKIPAAMSLFLLIDRGRAELDAPVARYWPEFAQGGKAAVTVREALSHRAGVPGLDAGISMADFIQWDIITARLAAEPHWFAGKPRLTYHAMMYVPLIGEIVRRIDGRMPGVFFAEEIAGPIGADVHLGLADRADEARLSRPKVPAPGPAPDPTTLFGRIRRSVAPPAPEDRGSWAILSGPSSALANGRGLARMMAVFANRGTLDNHRVLSEEIVAEAGRSQAFEKCPLMGWLNMGLVFGLHSDPYPLPMPTAMAWGGQGGSWAVADPSTGLSLGYAPNNFDAPVLDDRRLMNLGRAFHSVATKL